MHLSEVSLALVERTDEAGGHRGSEGSWERLLSCTVETVYDSDRSWSGGRGEQK
jgi:hypothetical protein